MKVGDVISWSRRFSKEDIDAFTAVSGDDAAHHTGHDDKGRILVHGLLTATLPTRVGGALDYIARIMNFEFRRPVYCGDTIRCDVTLTELTASGGGTRLTAHISCVNQQGKEVLRGETRGLLRRPYETVLHEDLPELPDRLT